MIAAALSQAVLVVLMSSRSKCAGELRCLGEPVAVESIPMPSMAACQAELPAVRIEKHVLHAFCVDQQERGR